MSDTISEKKNIKVAVIGGGVFGCTTAITLAREGYAVDLFEKNSDIMQAASGINQYRMHKGYHYPRSSETIVSCREATPEFEQEYKDAVIKGVTQYYSIAKEGSFLTGDEYLEVLSENNLPFTKENPEHINPDSVDVTIKAEENLYDPYKLKSILLERLKTHNVSLNFNTEVDVDDLDEYDFIVAATYAASNSVFKKRPELQREYQFEVCEKIVVEIPDSMKNISTVIMDGPFTCFDPLGDTGYAVMGHVEHAVLHRSYGTEPELPEEIKENLNKGIVKEVANSKAADFLASAAYFMPALKDVKHIGSMFTVRTVLPKVDATDARPTLVNMVDDRIITVYSGKVGNSVRAAKNILGLIKEKL